MKSLQNEAAAHCPHGCQPFDITYWSLIRADQDADLKTALLGGELNLVRCPECGCYFFHDGEVIYLDHECELMAFVFAPKDKERAQELRGKIANDYQTLAPTLFAQLKLDFPPLCVFGLEELQHVLKHQEELAAESEVVAAYAAEAGFKLVRLKPSYARENHFPFYVPAPKISNPAAKDYALAAAKVLKGGLHSPLLLNFKDHMSQEEAQPPALL